MTATRRKIVVVPSNQSGNRLDCFLRFAMPEWGRRAGQKACKQLRVLVDGHVARKSQLILKGQQVEILPEKVEIFPDSEVSSRTRVLDVQSGYGAVYKPDCMHSQKGKNSGSVEEVLPALFPESDLFMLNRLDYLTSGIVLVAFNEDDVRQYKMWQDSKKIFKWYLTVVQGLISEELLLCNKISSAKRRKVHVENEIDYSELRSSRVIPIEIINQNQTLALVKIFKGGRHQIRAHLAHAGYPVADDPLYADDGYAAAQMRLHHFCLQGPQLKFTVWPEWEVSTAARKQISEQIALADKNQS